MITKHKYEHRQRIKAHIRKKVRGTLERPRLTVFRSLRHVYAQIVDDASNRTLAAASDLDKEGRAACAGVKGQVNVGKKVGELLAQRAIAAKISQVVFDRSGYRYHGVVKALADGARAGGLKF